MKFRNVCEYRTAITAILSALPIDGQKGPCPLFRSFSFTGTRRFHTARHAAAVDAVLPEADVFALR